MTPEFRARELQVGSSPVLVCLKCVSDYRVAQRGECGCREANERAGLSGEFSARVGEPAGCVHARSTLTADGHGSYCAACGETLG